METPCTQLPPSTPPQVGPAGWTSALGPMNSGSAGRLAVGRVKFFGQHRGEVNSSAFSPDGQRLLTASEDGYVYGWETQSGRLLWRLGGHAGPIKFCRFSPDGHLFATTSGDCTIRLWDVAEAKCLHVLKGHQRSVETVSFSPDSKQLASGGWDKRVVLWEVQSGQMLRHLGGHRDSVQSSDFAPSSDCLATGSWDSAICIWDLRTGTPVTSHQELEGHSGNISCLCYSASGLLASGSWDKTIHIWKPSTRNLLVQLKGHVTWVKSIAFSPDGSQLASAGYSHMVKVWDCNTGKCMETLKGAWDLAERAPERTVRAAARHRPKVTLTEHPTDPCDQDWSRSRAGAANSRRQACQSPQAPSNHNQGTPAHLSSTVR
ncbi:WD repeat-containing protein 38 [Lynx canadensis]|uniref:WD repeat-containing protein 38 n=1 Tax=Lynx canadensis TaxID=61383 RepID=UPI0013C482B0|nr:WD repeat-containing protein 38 [Lynx canadensis]